MARLSAPARAGIGAAALGALALSFFWPGAALYDSVTQYRQAVSGIYDDWHPPAMARLWSGFHALGLPGQAPMFALQMLFYWGGLGLIAVGLARAGARIAAGAVLLLGLWPPFLGWEAAVLKDAQMVGALVAAAGLVAWRRLGGEAPRPIEFAAVALLIGYATLLRANAIFAAAPLAAGLFVPWQWRRWSLRFALIAMGTLAALALAPAINHHLLGARPSGVEATQPIFDMAGIAHRAGPDAVPLLPSETWRRVEAERCSSSVLWDVYASGQRCGFVQEELTAHPAGALYAGWAAAIRDNPGAYAAHRLTHWNATMRWFVPWHFPLTRPMSGSEPNRLGLASPATRVEPFDDVAGWLANGPLGAPILAFAAAVAVLALARPAASAAHGLAATLALSAVAMELSFLVVSISSDWRYHLWSMLAAWLSAILLVTRPLPRRAAGIALAMLMLIAASTLGARLLLPPVGDNYEDLLG